MKKGDSSLLGKVPPDRCAVLVRWKDDFSGLKARFAERLCLVLFATWAFGPLTFPAAGQVGNVAPAPSQAGTVVELEGKAEFMARAQPPWAPLAVGAGLSPGDRVRVLQHSRLVLQLAGRSTVRFSPGADFIVDPPVQPRAKPSLTLLRGLLYLFHRDEPVDARFQTRTVSAAVRGTEFVLEALDDGGAALMLVEGEVDLSNELGSISLRGGDQGVARTGERPVKSPVVETINLVQWCLHYPAVLDVGELELNPAELAALANSLAAYRQGDLHRALALFPPERFNDSPRLQVYAAALSLAVGQVAEAEGLLSNVPVATGNPPARLQQLAGALRLLIAAVKLGPQPNQGNPILASEWLAESYFRQSEARLPQALEAARFAVRQDPDFGFGWVRVAELEFSFGRTKAAQEALNEAVRLAPRHAQALVLQGFILSSRNRIDAALRQFDEAIAADGALGNAWLGRGLCRIRVGQVLAGLQDIQVAATLEPQRGLYRSYLGKAYNEARDIKRADKELQLAKELDRRDPTAWLYSGLLHQQENEINQAIGDFEQSLRANDDRRVYRSRLLLDQDRAVRGANLAAAYQDAGMEDVAVREAGRAVTADYANASAHLFLANSFNQLRDPKQVNLRYETAWFSEFLVANLLAPVGAGRLSQTISEQEYSKLFERDRFGVASSTEYSSQGEWFQTGVQHGTFGNSSYAAEAFYHSSDGYRPNNDLEQLALNLRLKQQVSPRDSVFAQIGYYDAEYGDVNQYYDPSEAIPGLRAREAQEPTMLLGHHHEWSPGNHTLLLASRVDDRIKLFNPSQQLLWLSRDALTGEIADAMPVLAELDYSSELELFSGELQHIWQRPAHAVEVGVRFQSGELHTGSAQDDFSTPFIPVLPRQEYSTDLERLSVYGYHQWQVFSPLWLVAGVSYDYVEYPLNFRFPPITDGRDTVDQVSPKGGFIWTPVRNTTIRGAYTRSLGGVSLDQSHRLEPSQVAGFNQAYRSVIPESVEGANSVPRIETWNASLEQKLGRGTYLGVSGELLRSEVDRNIGVVEFGPLGSPGPLVPLGFYQADTRESLDYRERSAELSAYQPAGDWSFGIRYRFSKAELQKEFTDIPAAAAAAGGVSRRQDLEASLHQLKLFAVYHHSSGFFGLVESLWNAQSNGGYSGTRPGDAFWQFNTFAGYRTAQRRIEVRLGVVNLTGQDYRLNPLNLTRELPHERALVAGLRFAF